jgi:glutaredoxin
MANVTLLVSKSCSACPSAKTLWKGMKVKYSFSYREIDITSEAGQELAERHSIRAVPATLINGRLTFIGVPPRESAEKALQAKTKPKLKKNEDEELSA